MRIGRARREIERARPKCRQADARLARQSTMCRRHEGRGLLMTGQHQLDAGGPQRFQQVEIFLAWHAEDALNAFVFQRGDKKVRSFRHSLNSQFHLFDGTRDEHTRVVHLHPIVPVSRDRRPAPF